jgi:hypothetical protein
MARTALGVVAGGATAFLWFFLLYYVWFFIPVESPPQFVDGITKWFPLTVALPALLLAGIAAALVAREFWALASILSGALIVGFVGWVLSGNRSNLGFTRLDRHRCWVGFAKRIRNASGRQACVTVAF